MKKSSKAQHTTSHGSNRQRELTANRLAEVRGGEKITWTWGDGGRDDGENPSP